MIKFISHEHFPDDSYTKELVYLDINNVRYGYVRREMKNGLKFWGPISLSAVKNGKKEFFDGHLFDSSFLIKDIKDFLQERSWEKKTPPQHQQYKSPPPIPEQTSFLDECPF